MSKKYIPEHNCSLFKRWVQIWSPFAAGGGNIAFEKNSRILSSVSAYDQMIYVERGHLVYFHRVYYYYFSIYVASENHVSILLIYFIFHFSSLLVCERMYKELAYFIFKCNITIPLLTKENSVFFRGNQIMKDMLCFLR